MTMLEVTGLFDEVLEFLASTPTPKQIIAFKPSSELQQHASDLLDKQRDGVLNDQDKVELDEFERLNHFMSMLKIRARKKLSQQE